MKIDKKFGQKISIDWIDAYSSEGWLSVEQTMEIPNEVYCFTTGWYVGEVDGFVIITHTKGKTKDNDIMGRLLIPKVWIRRVQ